MSKLSNYLRTYRKQTGLSQDEVAFLLGWRSAAHLSRYENFTRTPALRAALALEIIFRAAPKDLFAGEYQKVEAAVCHRARHLEANLALSPSSQTVRRKLDALRIIGSGNNSQS